MILALKTLAAVNDFTQRQQELKGRDHLGASSIGSECHRKAFYSYRWASSQYKEARLLRLFNRGHREEEVVIKLLRGAGMAVYHAGESGDHKDALRISDHGGHFGGTADGVVTGCPDLPEGEPALLEIKTHSDDLFCKIKKDGVYISNRNYYVQMQLYMGYLELKWGLYVGVNKNNDHFHIQIIEFNPSLFEAYRQHAYEIITAILPPKRINESPGFWKCKTCDHNKVCHLNGDPQVNCRTCRWASPANEGRWNCGQGFPEVATQPTKGCMHWQRDLNLFPDGIPF